MNDQSKNINQAIVKLTKRADQVDRDRLAETFVDTGALVSLLTNIDHQVIYGRRGTGKTHALAYLSDWCLSHKSIPIYVDLRVIGSSGGLYSDGSISICERATRLLQDALCAVHERLLEAVTYTDQDLDLGVLGIKLDNLAEAITEILVEGETTASQQTASSIESGTSGSFDISAKPIPQVGIKGSLSDNEVSSASRTTQVRGVISHRVHFSSVQKCVSEICSHVGGKRIWILLDEWSDVPIDLQPLLAHMIRKCLLCTPGVSVKIAAIEQRSDFQSISTSGADYVGIELGADASADLNFDDFMVFDNSADRATDFFAQLLFLHVTAIAREHKLNFSITDVDEFIGAAFTQRNVFEEFVRSAEGVPRDAINILVLSAVNAGDRPISIEHVRKASKTWYQRDKERAVSANTSAKDLLHWIIEEVIAHRKARAFLLASDVKDKLIDALFDARVLHVLKKGISSHDTPGERYDVYKIDYGCYVDLLTTIRSPQGLLLASSSEGNNEKKYIDVPPDDYRAIRRAILDLDEWRGDSS